MPRDITITAPEEIVVKAVGAGPSTAPPSTTGKTAVPAAIEAQAMEALKSLDKRLNDALTAHIERRQSADLQEAELIFPPNLWSLATYGPIQLNAATVATGNPPYDVNRVIQNGGWAAMIGISYADPTTMPPTNMYLASKEFRGRFSVVNLTKVTAGPGGPEFINHPLTPHVFGPGGYVVNQFSVPIAPPGAFSVSPFHYFLWIFQVNTTGGSEGELYECNFHLDISFPGVPGGGFSNWSYNTDVAPGMPGNSPFPWALPGVPPVPGTVPAWRYGAGTRFMVNNFPG